uniref:Uncharacterized protein n=1 Tax=Brassica oleracea var. oleracea TaxID=109376 RepID=A0A0D3CS57_BRAOL
MTTLRVFRCKFLVNVTTTLRGFRYKFHVKFTTNSHRFLPLNIKLKLKILFNIRNFKNFKYKTKYENQNIF